MGKRTPHWYRSYSKHTIDQIAEILGIHKSNYSRKERGLTRFTLDEALKLASLYQVPVEAIDFPASEVAQDATDTEAEKTVADLARPHK